MQTMITDIFSVIPFQGDMTENETILKFAFALKAHYPDVFAANLDKVVQTCLMCIVNEKCAVDIPPKTKRDIGIFL